MKKKSFLSSPTQWIAGAAATLTTTHSASAATLMIDFVDHDLTTSTSTIDFNGVSDGGGRWLSATVNPSYLKFNFTPYAAGGYNTNLAHTTIGGRVGTANIGVTSSSGGLMAWDLANGTKGWLHIRARVAPSLRLYADYFVFDDVDDQVRPTHAGAFHNVFDGATVTTTKNSSAVAVPEPTSLALLALGAAGVFARRRRSAS